MKKIIGTVQINNSFSGQNYLPYAVGILESYARRHLTDPEQFDFRVPVYKRLGIDQAVKQLLGCDLVGFSVYVWNFQISLEIARRLRSLDKSVIVVFGGPHVPDDAIEFLTDNQFIDLAVHGEGERTFTEILENMHTRRWDGIAGLTYRSAYGEIVREVPRQRLRNLSEVPSPFLDDIFEPVMRANPSEQWIGLWETNRGCPFKCAYCDWGSATADKVAVFEEERLLQEVEWFSNKKIEFIFCCDANFGIKKRDVDLARYVAEIKKKTGYPAALSVQNTKNATERAYQTQKILADAGLNKGVALSMQSLDETTLNNIMRGNISLETYFELQRRFAKDNIETFSDIILGMPGETFETLISGVDTLIRNGQHNRIQFNNLSILPNAAMANPEYKKEHGLITVRSKIINIHGEKIEIEDDVPEYQELVVATATMPKCEWRLARAMCWMTALLHFNKLFQIPMILANSLTELSYRNMIKGFIDVEAREFPVLGEIRDFFLEQAHVIQEGGTEFYYSADWLGIHWPQDEFVYIQLTADGRLEKFYEEAHRLIIKLVRKTKKELVSDAIADAVNLNKALLKQPGRLDDIEVISSHNIMEFYLGAVRGSPAELVQRPTITRVDRSSCVYEDFQKWCREVVWWGNKKGAYLYANQTVEKQLAGHF